MKTAVAVIIRKVLFALFAFLVAFVVGVFLQAPSRSSDGEDPLDCIELENCDFFEDLPLPPSSNAKVIRT